MRAAVGYVCDSFPISHALDKLDHTFLLKDITLISITVYTNLYFPPFRTHKGIIFLSSYFNQW